MESAEAIQNTEASVSLEKLIDSKLPYCVMLDATSMQSYFNTDSTLQIL